MDEQFLSPLEVAEILQVKKNTVYEMIKRGDLKATKMGKQFRIARKDVYEYMGVMPETESPENIVICGQDQLLDVLCALYNSQSDGHTQVYRSPMGSYSGLYRMYQNENYVATCHMWDGATDTYNLPYIERMLPGEQVAVFHLLKRWQGFYVKEGNPKNIQKFEDLLREDVRMINREKGPTACLGRWTGPSCSLGKREVGSVSLLMKCAKSWILIRIVFTDMKILHLLI